MIPILVTIEKIVNDLEDISIQNRKSLPEHLSIKSFGYGPVSNVNQLAINGTCMYVEQGEMEIQDSISRYSFIINIVDLLNDDNSNLKSVLSDTAQVCVDIIKRLRRRSFYLEHGYKVQNIVTGSPGENIWAQRVGGWVLNVTFECFNGTFCDTAFADDVVIPTGSTPAPVETLYYIASTSDIYGENFVVRWDASEDFVDGTELTYWSTDPDTFLSTDDRITYGYGYRTPIAPITGTTISVSSGFVKVNIPNMKALQYGRIAKLTSFTTATYSNPYTYTQSADSNGQIIGEDATPYYLVGDVIRFTLDDGSYIYDIVEQIAEKSGNTTFDTYLRYIIPVGTTCTVEKMTNIV